MKPYVYIIKSLKEDKYYIGSRCISKIKPENDLLVKYFTSSFVVKSIIEKNGIEDIVIHSIKTFESSEECILYEDKLLRSIPKSRKHKFLNINFSAGGAVIKSQSHCFITDGIEYRQYPRDVAPPEGWWFEHKYKPPNRGGYVKILSKDGLLSKHQHKDKEIPEGWISLAEYKKIKKKENFKQPKVYWITDGVNNARIEAFNILREGWSYGRTNSKIKPRKERKPNSKTTKGMRLMNNGVVSTYIEKDKILPEGWVYGKLPEHISTKKLGPRKKPTKKRSTPVTNAERERRRLAKTGTKAMHKPEVPGYVLVKLEDIEKKIKEGFILGIGKKGK